MWWHKVNRTLDFSSQLFIRLFLQQQLQILSYINYSIDFSSEPLSFLLFFSLLKKQKQALRYHLVSRLFSSDIKVRHTGFWCSMSLDSMVRTAQQVVDVPWTCKDVPFCHKAKVFRFAADTALFRSENYNILFFFLRASATWQFKYGNMSSPSDKRATWAIWGRVTNFPADFSLLECEHVP